jgi:3',5'-cyclic AMP phosphodiesterase CpdA
VIFTGDLTHTTDDPKERRKRMTEFRDIVSALKVKEVRFIPGEHDASLDNGKAFKEFFGPTNYTFDHKGVHFIVLDNVSDPAAQLGEAQLAWLADDLKKQAKDAHIVVFAHRPLFDLYPQWDWATRDGAKAVDLLLPYDNVTVFYGHIHQENHHMTGHIAHHSAKSLIFALPAPASQPKRLPVPWDAAQPYAGLGWRQVEAEPQKADYVITEMPVQKG